MDDIDFQDGENIAERTDHDEGRSSLEECWLSGDVASSEILKARARRLAEVPAADGLSLDHVEVVVFTLSGEQYALETRFVREAAPLRSLTPLPGVPPFIAGISNLRSEVVSVVNLAAILNISPEKHARAFVLYLQNAAMSFGAAVDTVAGVRDINLVDLHESGASLSAIPQRYLRGITVDGVALLDAHAILTDERLIVRN